MKLFTLILLFSSSTLFATEIKDVEMFGYARAGVGSSTMGGDQECFYNQGAGGWGGVGRNEFRLGNECTNYFELGTKFNHLKGESKWAYTQIRLANSHNGSDNFEHSSQTTDFVELFAEAYGLNNIPASFWIGKRYYRAQDAYLDDYYYFGNMSGNGAGFGRLKTLGGELSLAYLKKVDDGSTDAKTQHGKPSTNMYDVRLNNIQLSENLKEHFWFVYGHAQGGTNTTSSTTHYDKTNGFIAGTLFDYNLFNSGFNHFSVSVGRGLMNSLNVYGDNTVQIGDEANSQNNKTRVRLIDFATYKINSNWQGHVSFSHERLYKKSDLIEQWASFAIRPIYVVNDSVQLVTEAGTSFVVNGGTRKLTRLTFAPQLGLNADIWGRPVFRAFYTHSFWSSNNKSNIASNAPSFANKTDGGSYGFQMETFF